MWLQDWDRVHIHGETARAAPGAGNQRKDMSKKALLVSGPPGIGKTTSSHIISKCAALTIRPAKKCLSYCMFAVALFIPERMHLDCVLLRPSAAAEMGKRRARAQQFMLRNVEGAREQHL